jgi:hypothetical protein
MEGIDSNSAEFRGIKAYKLQMEINLGTNAYKKLRYTFQELGVPSIKVLRRQMKSLSGLKPKAYDCCRSCCVCFTGAFANDDACVYCHLPRRRPDGTAYHQFVYIPIIPQLQSMYANARTAKSMRYRSEHEYDNLNHPDHQISDIYDSKLYRTLRASYVVVNDQVLPHKFFADPRDVLLVMMTDGFQLFKRAKQTAWPLILLNANLPPSERYHVNNVVCAGMVPGPKKPKNFNSFMAVVADELAVAAVGIVTFDALENAMFEMHAFAPYGTGDMPAAAAAFTGCKHHNAKHPCRECPVEAIRIRNSPNKIHYVPIIRPQSYPASPFAANSLPRRTHKQWLTQARRVDTAPTITESKRLAKLYGIHGTPTTARIPGITFPWSFPFDFMHILENLMKNYVLLISGEFKMFDNGCETYILVNAIWKEIGLATVEANKTIPSAFGRRVPDIAEDRTYFTAEAYLVWWTMYAPILLRGRFNRPKYYTHLSRIISIINTCLAFTSTAASRAQLRIDIVTWYEEFEK